MVQQHLQLLAAGPRGSLIMPSGKDCCLANQVEESLLLTRQKESFMGRLHEVIYEVLNDG